MSTAEPVQQVNYCCAVVEDDTMTDAAKVAALHTTAEDLYARLATTYDARYRAGALDTIRHTGELSQVAQAVQQSLQTLQRVLILLDVIAGGPTA